MKLILSAAFVMLTTLPATAFERMQRSACQATVQRIADLFPENDAATQARLSDGIGVLRVTPQGWCQFRARDTISDAKFERLEWRMDGTSRWTRDGIPPLALQVRIFAIDTNDIDGGRLTTRPTLDIDVTLRQVPDAGMVIVERAVIENDAGDSLAVSGVFERMFLSSPSMMQVSIGAATLKAGLMSMTLDGTHENPFGFDIAVEMQGNPQAQFDAAFHTISALPDGVVDAASRAELTAFASDLPNPVGTLDLSVASERGLGLMQVFGSVSATAMDTLNGETSNLARHLDIMLDGLTLSANWTPDTPNAD